MTVSGNRARLLVGALILSVCFNIFAAAALGGHLFRDERGRGRGSPIARLVDTAPEAAQPVFKAHFDANRDELSRRIEAAREARRAFARMLRNPDIDRAALENALTEISHRSMAIQQLVHATFLDAVAELPPEIRAQWAEEWQGR